METEIDKVLKKEQKKKRKEEEKNLEKEKDRAREWWDEVTMLFYDLTIDATNKKYKASLGTVIVDEEIKTQAAAKYESDKKKKIILYFIYLVACMIFLLALTISVYFKKVSGIFWSSVAMIAVYYIIKAFENRHRLGVRKYFDEKDSNKEKVYKAIALLAKAKGCTKDDLNVFFLSGFQKKRLSILSLYHEQILGIIFAAMLLPCVSQLFDQQYEWIILTFFSHPMLIEKRFVLLSNVPVLGITVYAVIFWLMSLVICILIQLPANILINKITKMLTTDELLFFYKDCLFEDRLKKVNKLENE